MERKLEVSAIENGTVIDHIPADALFKIINILGLENQSDLMMTFGMNFSSKSMGRIAIIKISDRYCEDHEINRIAVVAPNACVNTIRDFKVVEKRLVKLPEQIDGFIRCGNPKCITNAEAIETHFKVGCDAGGQVTFECRYCEKVTRRDEAQFKY